MTVALGMLFYLVFLHLPCSGLPAAAEGQPFKSVPLFFFFFGGLLSVSDFKGSTQSYKQNKAILLASGLAFGT